MTKHLIKGSRVRVCVPEDLPSPYNKFHPVWQTFVKGLHNEFVTLDKLDMMAVSDPLQNNVPGWEVHYSKRGLTTSTPAGERVTPWLPNEWLLPISSKIPCNCPIKIVLRSGCQDPNHD